MIVNTLWTSSVMMCAKIRKTSLDIYHTSLCLAVIVGTWWFPYFPCRWYVRAKVTWLWATIEVKVINPVWSKIILLIVANVFWLLARLRYR